MLISSFSKRGHFNNKKGVNDLISEMILELI